MCIFFLFNFMLQHVCFFAFLGMFFNSVCLTVSHYTHSFVLYYYRHADVCMWVIPLLISVSCLLSSWLFLLKWMCCYGSRELANQSAGCISLLEIAAKNQLPDCAAVNHVIGRDVPNGCGPAAGVCLLRKNRCAEPARFRLCLALSQRVAGAVTPGASPPTL